MRVESVRRGLALGVCLLATPAWAGGGNVLLLSWDGSHPAVVQELLAQDKLPVLQSLLTQGGRWHDLMFTDQLPVETVTKPGHAQMLTGQPKEVTGVLDNKNWAVIPAGMTLPEQWHAVGARTGIVVQKPHLAPYPQVGVEGPLWRVWQIADCSAQSGKGGPGSVATQGLRCLAQFGSSRFFLFLHSKQPDESGHATGAGSTKYRAMLTANDVALGRVLVGLPPQTQVVITTDHAFGDNNAGGCPSNAGEKHRACPNVWAVSFPALTLAGTRLMDLAPALRP